MANTIQYADYVFIEKQAGIKNYTKMFLTPSLTYSVFTNKNSEGEVEIYFLGLSTKIDFFSLLAGIWIKTYFPVDMSNY